MGNGGDEIVFHSFRCAEFIRHIIYRIAKIADFIIGFLFNFCVKIALGDFFRGFADLSDRVYY